MNRSNEDNTVFVLHKIMRRFKMKVSGAAIKNFLHAHPYFPTLKSVCDALKKWGIEHYPLKLDNNEIRELELPFIAHLNISGGQLAFVERIGKEKVEYFIKNGKKQTEDFNEFAKKLSGAVILIEPNQKIYESNYRPDTQNKIIERMLLPAGILAILLVSLLIFSSIFNSIFYKQLVFIELLVIAIFGITASVFLVLHEFKIHTSVGDKLCGFSSKTDCDSVLSSNATKLFGNINWADAGLIYFVGVFIFLLGSASISSLSLLAILSVLSLPYPVYSIYYQGIKLKKWCPFCLLVQLLLIGEFVVMLPVFKNLSFSGFDFLRLATAFFVPSCIWILYKTLREKVMWGGQQQYSLLTLKRNPDIFRSLLTNGGYAEFDINSKSLVLGDYDAPVTITAFLSLYCNPCAGAFEKLKALIETCSEVRLNAIFSVYNDEETQKLINTIYYRYSTKGAVDILVYLNNWYTSSQQLRKTLYENEIIPEEYNVALKVAETTKSLFNEFKIAGTPTVFVNGFKFPNQYDYSDLEYFIDDIKQLTRENKRQEACTNCN